MMRFLSVLFFSFLTVMKFKLKQKKRPYLFATDDQDVRSKKSFYNFSFNLYIDFLSSIDRIHSMFNIINTVRLTS